VPLAHMGQRLSLSPETPLERPNGPCLSCARFPSSCASNKQGATPVYPDESTGEGGKEPLAGEASLPLSPRSASRPRVGACAAHNIHHTTHMPLNARENVREHCWVLHRSSRAASAFRVGDIDIPLCRCDQVCCINWAVHSLAHHGRKQTCSWSGSREQHRGTRAECESPCQMNRSSLASGEWRLLNSGQGSVPGWGAR
jgi:hypothetical protein